MNEAQHEQAALFALGLLQEDDARALTEDMARDAELRDAVSALQDTAAQLAFAIGPSPPSAETKTRVIAAVRDSSQQSKAGAARAAPRASWSAAGWGVAAALAVGACWLWLERAELSSRVRELSETESAARAALFTSEQQIESLTAEKNRSASQVAQLSGEMQTLRNREEQSKAMMARLTGEVEALRQRDAMARMEIATLQSSVEAYKQGVAVVVWDSEKHQGVLKLEKMPPLDPAKDYQLWVVDPAKKAPVDAGIVRVDEKGFARIDFKPVDAVSSAAKFALSVERKGGVPQNEGPIVFIGP